MRIRLSSILLAGLLFLATAVPIRACGYGMPSPFARFTLAEFEIVGKVIGFEGRMVSAQLSAEAPTKQEFAVAEVEILQALKGAEGLTHLRIGFAPAENLQVGQIGCFFLNPHFAEPFYLMPPRFGLPTLRDNNPGFEAEVKEYERWGNLLHDPNASLQSENAEDRRLTAALLISAYRTFQVGVHAAGRKTAPIDAAQSKLILLALAEADWTKAVSSFEAMPSRLFNQLQIGAQDGWKPQGFKTAQDMAVEAKKWLKENAPTYRIQAFVRM